MRAMLALIQLEFVFENRESQWNAGKKVSKAALNVDAVMTRGYARMHRRCRPTSASKLQTVLREGEEDDDDEKILSVFTSGMESMSTTSTPSDLISARNRCGKA